MVHIPDKKLSPSSEKCGEIPGYLKWRHLTSGQNDARLPKFVSFLIRVITLTDSVISFNSTKRLTNTLQSVCRTVSHLTNCKITEMHYRQILHIFGEIYVYTPSQFKGVTNLIVSKVEMENRLMVCERKAITWIRAKYSSMHPASITTNLAKEIDQLIMEDAKFKASMLPDADMPVLHEACALSPPVPMQEIEIASMPEKKPEVLAGLDGRAEGLHGAPDLPSSNSPPLPNKRALSILERIRQREQERRESFIRMEEEKEKEVVKAAHAIFSLAITLGKRSFEQEFIEKKVSLFAQKTVTIEDVLKHPLTKNLIREKETEDSTKYLLLDLEKYKNTHLNKR
ncbi:uncharacterized protein NEMAJ01_0087 [Nematocida major]|uniref:uncharacterized protein n=1 Tax=Nematocida major TaxID=1912982 RepID=UPI002007512E|nr:uncharacterized protein NEMAJ01_0087 [Nematocida major]KAH9385191.1 hypothetical protein NEMAJ01_0087 [Nematocida major]